MADLRSKKSCHTGFGRNVGYKIPITRLKKNGVLKISSDPALSSVEKELKALSEFFTESCIVGTYSPDHEVNKDLSTKYFIENNGNDVIITFLQNKSIQTYVLFAKILLNATTLINIPVMTDQSDV